MNILKKIRSHLRHFFLNFFGIDIKFVKKNIFNNIETPEYESINCLYRSQGILHIGAHRGSERYVYDWLGKEVIWIEANPRIFSE